MLSGEEGFDTFEVGSREDQSGRVRRTLKEAQSNNSPTFLGEALDLPQKLGTYRVSADSYLITKNFTVYGVRHLTKVYI